MRGAKRDLLARPKRRFEKVRDIKPLASRKDSAELYVAATGYRGAKVADDGRAVRSAP